MSTILDTQYFLINRDGYDYKVNALTLGQWVAGSDTMPWEEHIENGSGGVFHIINLTDDILYLSSGPYGSGESYESFGPHQAYSIKGEDLGTICSVPPLEEVVILTSENACGLFANNPNIEWKFGPETNTTHVTNMEFMFHNCALFNADITDWNTEFVTNMDSMFNGTSKFNQDLRPWCVSLIESKPDRFDKDAIGWTGSRPMWGRCPSGLPWEGHNGGIWHIRNVTGALAALGRTYQDETVFTAYKPDGTPLGVISKIDIGEEVILLTDPAQVCLFWGDGANTQAKYELGPLTDTSKVTNINRCFQYNKNFKGVGVEYMDTSNVTNMNSVFYECRKFNQDVSGWDVSKVNDMQSMFSACVVFNQDVSGWDTSSVGSDPVSNDQHMDNVFNSATAFNQDLSQWCTSNLVREPRGFDYGTEDTWTLPKPVWFTCPRNENKPKPWEGYNGGIWHIVNSTEDIKLQKVCQVYGIDRTDLGQIDTIPAGKEVVILSISSSMDRLFAENSGTWDFGRETDTSRVTSLWYLFKDCTHFNGVLGGNWDLSMLESASGVFEGAESFNQDISGWNMSRCLNLWSMFEGAKAFNQDISGWDVSHVTRFDSMFMGATAFNQDIGDWDMSRCLSAHKMFETATAFNQDIGRWDFSVTLVVADMFLNATAFNQDLSNWCVPLLDADPEQIAGFDDGAISWVLPDSRPVWGTCPPPPELSVCHRGDPSMPWEGHDGAIFHITNVTAKVNVLLQFAYKLDGTELGRIDEVLPGEEVIIVTDQRVRNTFAENIDLPNADDNFGEFELGPLTDTSKAISMASVFSDCVKFKGVGVEYMDVSNCTELSHMFSYAEEFNGDVSGWDVSKCENMIGIFSNCSSFNQDIGNWDVSRVGLYVASGPQGQPGGWDSHMDYILSMKYGGTSVFNQDLSKWCTPNLQKIPPEKFDLHNASWTLPKPVWGTCPPRQSRQAVTYNFTVTVNNTVSGNKYYLNGNQQQNIDAVAGDTIVFDQSDSSNTGHPLRIYTDSAKTNEVTTGVTIDGSTTTFVVSERGRFYYQCEVHSGMGSSINVYPVYVPVLINNQNNI